MASDDSVAPVRLLYAENTISRQGGRIQQNLEFRLSVENLAYDKKVEVHWCGEDGAWQILEAVHLCSSGKNREIWRAHVEIPWADDSSLPGDVQFTARCLVAGHEYWDKHEGKNHEIAADSGVVINDAPIVHVDHHPALPPGHRTLDVAVAVRKSVSPKRVYVRWTTDHWRTSHTSPCHFLRKYWDKRRHSNARNYNKYGCGIWVGHLAIDDAFGVEYAVACDTATGTLWDSNLDQNYVTRHHRMKVLTLNMHCYQERDQDGKLTQIARAIGELDIDMVCLQEVGENWNDGRGDWSSNAAREVRDRIGKPYDVHAAGSHLGFDRYLEGCAILSKHGFVVQDAGYVSSSQDLYDIHARKAVMAQVHVPHIGLVNVFSVHLSWWSAGLGEQISRLKSWAEEKHAGGVVATLLCGDFNTKPQSHGYAALTWNREFEDQFLQGSYRDPHGPDRSRRPLVLPTAEDGRIDYVFLKKGSRLRAVDVRPLFVESDGYGRVSDHEGYYVEFEPEA